MKSELEKRAQARDCTFSHFSYEANVSTRLEALFQTYGETGIGQMRHYVHDQAEAAKFGVSPGNFTDWRDFEPNTDLLLYEGLHEAVVNDTVNIVQYADLKIGIVSVIKLSRSKKDTVTRQAEANRLKRLQMLSCAVCIPMSTASFRSLQKPPLIFSVSQL